ncbi:MAG: DNA-deoxyinosine glycosylase [Clostridiales bacterium]|nr:DNA-deoxyinosine glycosylase [Clostridiales bacterium]
MQRVDHPFPPVVDANCHILILGSFPSVKSRENGFFYGHPQNRFWRMLAAIFDEEIPEDIPAKKALLLRHHIALWDVIASCDIQGSSDASVKNATPVDISRVTDAACIDRVICNGSLAGKLYQRYLETHIGIKAFVLPSTSPANAACSLGKLVDSWRKVLLT